MNTLLPVLGLVGLLSIPVLLMMDAPVPEQVFPLPWGQKVSPAFRRKVYWIAGQLQTSPYWLMAVMAFETGETFSPSILNKAGSGAIGLIQFLPSTARRLGTTAEALSTMSPEYQLEYVYRYLRSYSGRLVSLEELYCAVYRPVALGLPLTTPLQLRGSDAYAMNKGFDKNFDGVITKSEMASAVVGLYRRELSRFRASQPYRSVS